MEQFVIMAVLAVASAVAGAVLRLRWTVLSLVPAMVVATIVIAGVGMARSCGFWSIVLAVAVGSTCLQIGYLGGQVLHRAVWAARRWRAPWS